MRALLLATAALFAAPAPAQTPKTNVVADPAAPKGKLSDAAVPKAYRLDFTIDPTKPRFSGHDEIDVTLKAATSKLYLHGRDLTVSRVVAKAGGRTIAAKWTQVDSTGVARLDFAQAVPAGAATLVFDYDGAFGSDASGLYHLDVGGKWYSWTQFESIDARAAYPGFDEPGFKTPFTISITTPAGNKTVSNAREVSVTPAGALQKHQFEATRPLPTYLVALVTGPFLRDTGAVPPTPQHATPLPLGVVATQAQAGKLDYAMTETKPIVALLEKYFGEPFPFPKLDQIASPVMPGAMENAGADIYGDSLLLLEPGADTSRRQYFGMVVAHELSHQWFGDLVTPAWWDDIWLNESFANWMGFRIGNEWRPELKIGVGAIDEALTAMQTDALKVGRPIHQPIATNGEIDSAFDTITYGKGGQVVAMIAAYLGDEKFRDGVRLHLKRHAYGNATSEQFFQSLADAAHDPRVVTAMMSFVDQQGVPTVDIRRDDNRLVATQSRYAYLGSTPAAEQWTIPLCVRVGDDKDCELLDKPSMALKAKGKGIVMPNVGGTGYYRFTLPAADWQALVAQAGSLPAGEALATTDSLWAAFAAGKAPAAWLFTEAQNLAGNPDSRSATDGGERLSGYKLRGLFGPQSDATYRRFLDTTYAPRLAAIGFDPAAGAHAGDDPDRQRLRTSLIALLMEAKDAGIRAKLKAAATAYLGGDTKALDEAFREDAFTAYAADGGLPAAKRLIALALGTEDTTVRSAALHGAAQAGRTDVADYLLALNDPKLRAFDRVALIQTLASTDGTVAHAGDWIIANYARLLAGSNGIFVSSRLPAALTYQCSAAMADKIERTIGPKVRAANTGVLEFERTVERVRNCTELKQARSAELSQALSIAAAGTTAR